MTGVAKGTILKLLAELGQACEEYQRKALRNLNCKRIQCDEIWNFCYAKQKNVPVEKQGQFGFGDVWTWVAIERRIEVDSDMGCRTERRRNRVRVDRGFGGTLEPSDSIDYRWPARVPRRS